MQERRWRSWRAAMQDALYGPHGFYLSAGAPARNFRTAAHASPLWAGAVSELSRRVDVALGEPEKFSVVDMGAGGGELIGALAALAPARWRLVGVDLAPRPVALPDRVHWLSEPPDDTVGLVIAVEWLDVVPADVVELTDDGLRLVEVATDGDERLGPPPSGRDVDWLDRWWRPTEPGDRAEVGWPRDDAWATAVGRVSRGVAVAVDYAVDPTRDVAGTLTGYREGRQCVPVPDGSCDITTHVLIDSCAAAVTDVETRVLSQREVLRQLGVDGARPAYDGDPQVYVAALSRAGEAAELLDPYGLGGFTWLVQARGVALPL